MNRVFLLHKCGNSQAKSIKANLDRLQDIENVIGENFKRLKNYIYKTGTLDYNLRKATIYRNNYIQTIKQQFSNLDGYKELYREFMKHKDPIEFFEWISKTENINIIDIHYESNNTLTQQQFYSYLEELGIEIKNQVVETG